MIGVQFITVALILFTGSLIEDLVIILGTNNLIASIQYAIGFEFTTNFTTNQVYDYLKGNLTSLNILSLIY